MKTWVLIFNLFILTLLILFGAFYASQYWQGEGKKEGKETVSFNLEGKNYKLLLADTARERARGLMFVREADDFDGMLFIFQEKEARTFWNKNTYLDLDIYWFRDDKVVGKDFLPSIEKSKEIITVTSPVLVNKVVELIKR